MWVRPATAPPQLQSRQPSPHTWDSGRGRHRNAAIARTPGVFFQEFAGLHGTFAVREIFAQQIDKIVKLHRAENALENALLRPNGRKQDALADPTNLHGAVKAGQNAVWPPPATSKGKNWSTLKSSSSPTPKTWHPSHKTSSTLKSKKSVERRKSISLAPAPDQETLPGPERERHVAARPTPSQKVRA